MLKKILIILTAVLIFGCSSYTKMAKRLDPNTDFGPKPVNYVDTIKVDFANKYPWNLNGDGDFSYRISTPVKLYVGELGVNAWYHWAVELTVPYKSVTNKTALKHKNKTLFILFEGNKIKRIIDIYYHNPREQYKTFVLTELGESVLAKSFDFTYVYDELGQSMAKASQTEAKTSNDVSAEIRKLNALYKEGILTEEEFTKKKQQLLGI